MWITGERKRYDCARLQWPHNGHNGISNHQPHDCLLNRLFRCRSKKTSKLRVTGLCSGKWPVNSPHKWPVMQKLLPFGDVIMNNDSSHIRHVFPIGLHQRWWNWPSLTSFHTDISFHWWASHVRFLAPHMVSCNVVSRWFSRLNWWLSAKILYLQCLIMERLQTFAQPWLKCLYYWSPLWFKFKFFIVSAMVVHCFCCNIKVMR